jgi:MFS family permease
MIQSYPGLSGVQINVIALMLAFSVASYFSRTIMSIASPGIMQQFALSEPQMGAIYTAFLISYALMNMPGGHLADRFGPRSVLTAVGVGAGMFTALTALGGKPGLGAYLGVFPAFFLIRFGMGLCTGPLYPTCARTISNWIPRPRHALVQGLVTAGAGLGGATSPLLFSWMIDTFGWQASFSMVGGAIIGLAFLWYKYARDYPWQHPRASQPDIFLTGNKVEPVPPVSAKRTAWRLLLTNPDLLILSFSCFTFNYFVYVYFFWIYYYLVKIRNFSTHESAVATTVVFLMGTIMSPFGGWLSDRLVEQRGERIGRRIVPVSSLTLGALLLCVAINVTNSVLTVAFLSLSFGFALSSDGPYWATAVRLGGRHAGAAGGILNTAANFGGVAPYFAPLIASHFGWGWGWYSASMVLAVGIVAWFFIDPTRTAEGVRKFP